eukprot:CAMPEP_0194205976 /NCGR_PEP_ID=MMETSP0156-20130528/5123_1 /TAXON_ID=33649 /ORGANISM="Thalassionema nitzschioides, Strain L26-B" /LENGTH=72 /DNA_ID=CAMNT_0038932385 /DNA_START=89 /DNA_END=307 /DNA_ORIENTATION=-
MAVKSVYPDAEVTPIMKNSYPIRVQVDVKLNGKTTKVWEGDQRNLFSKNANRRSKSIQEIQENLGLLKESML